MSFFVFWKGKKIGELYFFVVVVCFIHCFGFNSPTRGLKIFLKNDLYMDS